MRLSLRLIPAVLLLAAFDASAQTRSAAERHISSGWIRGTNSDVAGVLVFKGVRYAQPPVGDLRWKAPVSAVPWTGTQDATHFGAACPQVLRHSIPPFTEEFMEQGSTDEDCLYLNIWTPIGKGKNLPVVVFFHGGSFTEGSGDISAYDGSAMAAQGVVVVTANYRLGALGYLATSEMEAESPDHTAGNFGLRDQIEALRWIRANAAAFGGNAQAVTAMGQSAGARSVQALMASPQARGLFRSAIVESGIAASGKAAATTLSEAEDRGRTFMETAQAKTLKAMRALSVDTIMATQAKVSLPRLITDGVFVPACMSQLDQGCPLDVSVLTGWNSQEAGVTAAYGTHTAADYAAYVQKTFPDRAGAFFALYPGKTDAQANDSYLQAARDKNTVGFLLWVRARSVDAQSKIFAYYFDRVIPWKLHPEFSAHHTGEVPYVFGNLSRVKRDYNQVDRRLSVDMLSYWTNFIKTGNPNGSTLPPWRAYDAARPHTQELGEHVGGMNLLDADVVRFWTEYLGASKPVL